MQNADDASFSSKSKLSNSNSESEMTKKFQSLLYLPVSFIHCDYLNRSDLFLATINFIPYFLLSLSLRL